MHLMFANATSTLLLLAIYVVAVVVVVVLGDQIGNLYTVYFLQIIPF